MVFTIPLAPKMIQIIPIILIQAEVFICYSIHSIKGEHKTRLLRQFTEGGCVGFQLYILIKNKIYLFVLASITALYAGLGLY